METTIQQIHADKHARMDQTQKMMKTLKMLKLRKTSQKRKLQQSLKKRKLQQEESAWMKSAKLNVVQENMLL